MNTMDVPFINSAALRAILGGFLLVAATCRADVDEGPPPIEVRLETAKWVVIGQITKIDASKVQQNDPGVRWGLATVAVKEVLKGSAVKSIDFPVPTAFTPPDYGGTLQLFTHEVLVGQSGIWVQGQPAFFLFEGQRPDVRRILQALKEKKWSEPVNGLRAWALVIYPYDPNLAAHGAGMPARFPTVHPGLPGIIFAVKNVSDADIYLPLVEYRHDAAAPAGFFAATVKSAGGKTFEFPLLDAAHPRSERIPCAKLAPGETTYLHPGQWKRDKLTPGRYSAVVTCKNDRADGEVRDRSSPPPVTAWTGQLKAPPVEFVLTAEDVKGWKAAPGFCPATRSNGPASRSQSPFAAGSCLLPHERSLVLIPAARRRANPDRCPRPRPNASARRR